MIRGVMSLLLITVYVVSIAITIARMTVDGWTVIAAVCVMFLAVIAWRNQRQHRHGP